MANEMETLLNNGFTTVREKKKETAILMIHGFASSPKEFEPLSEYLKKDYDIYAPILPGHKTNVTDFSKKKYTDWLNFSENIYNYLQKEYSKVILLGFSMGGTICLNLAAKKSPYKMVIASTPIDFFDSNFTKGILKELRNLNIGVTTIVKEINALSIKENQEKEKDKKIKIDKVKTVLDDIYKKLKRDMIKVNNDMSDYLETYENISYNAFHELFLLVRQTRSKLSKIKCDILVLHSKGDRLIPFSNSKIITNEVASDDVELFIVTNSSHDLLIDVDYPIIFKRIKDFLQRTNDISETK